MSTLDWTLFLGFIGYVIWDGARQSKSNQSTDDYFVAGRTVPWWAVGLSIMATQASAITMLGTTGQGWGDGMRFVQFYFALPIAMILIAWIAVPAYHGAKVRTAYEYLGVRFDEKTRALSAILFLILRGLSVGFVIYTPSIVLAKVFDLEQSFMILSMGGVAILYTSIGGLRAVIATDIKQMVVMVLGLVVAFFAIVAGLPSEVGLGGAVSLAQEAGRLDIVDWSWNPSEKYTVWSSLIGGLFLFLSYFGTDQSQVQRLLAGRSVRDARGALMMNAVCKIPFQLLVLFMGALLFVFYLFQDAPLTFEPSVSVPTPVAAEYAEISAEFEGVRARLRNEAMELARDPASNSMDYRGSVEELATLRAEAKELRQGVGDKNYVFLDFILGYLPIGVVGLLLAAVFAAALSSIDSELNSMTTVAVSDIYRLFGKADVTERHLLRVAKVATVAVGLFATTFALFAGEMGSLIEAVNRVGSYIYGSLLGAFLLAPFPRANGNGAFVGLVVGMIAVALAAQTDLAFLYLNTVGAVTVVSVGMFVSVLTGESSKQV